MIEDCGCTHHPGLTHDEHMDQFDRNQNRRMIEDAEKNGTLSPALMWRFCELEIVRLREKARLMELGRIRQTTL